MTFVVAREPAAPADPSQCTLHDPAFWEHDKAVPVAAANDLEFPRAGAGDGGFHLLPLIARITDDALDEGEAPARLPEQRLCAISVLDTGRVDGDGQQQAERIGQDVALAANHLLAASYPEGSSEAPL